MVASHRTRKSAVGAKKKRANPDYSPKVSPLVARNTPGPLGPPVNDDDDADDVDDVLLKHVVRAALSGNPLQGCLLQRTWSVLLNTIKQVITITKSSSYIRLTFFASFRDLTVG